MQDGKSEYVYPVRSNARGTNADKKYTEWDKVEMYVFNKYVFPLLDKSRHVVLDLGAGEGKYSYLLSSYAEKLIVVEPDTHRLQKAKEALRDVYVEKSFIARLGEDLQIEDDLVDIALCVHVIQHITPIAASEIFSIIHKALKANGLFVLFFSDNTEYEDEFHISWKKNGHPIVTSIPESVFNLLTYTSHEGALQFRSIQKDKIISELKKLGFVLEVSQGYMPVYPNLLKKILRILMSVITKPITKHKMLHTIGYDNYIDRCLVFRKSV